MGLWVNVYEGVSKAGYFDKDFDFIADANCIGSEIDRVAPFELGKSYIGDAVERYEISYPYSTHNKFREKLYKLIAPSSKIYFSAALSHRLINFTTPFYEFFDSSDCDGVFGTEVCKKLWDDFKYFHSLVYEQPDGEFKELFEKWMHSFGYAATRDGAVVYK